MIIAMNYWMSRKYVLMPNTPMAESC